MVTLLMLSLMLALISGLRKESPGYFRIKSYGVGKYGRVLGEIFIRDIDGNEMMINETLVTEGHGYVYEGGKKQLFKG